MKSFGFKQPIENATAVIETIENWCAQEDRPPLHEYLDLVCKCRVPSHTEDVDYVAGRGLD